MGLIMIIGPQAVGKMTVGREIEKLIDGKLLYNHQTIDLFAQYLGYTKETFELSDLARKKLFKAFVTNKKNNPIETIIFTVVLDFDDQSDWRFLKQVNDIFRKSGEAVYILELFSDLTTRLVRNQHPDRLAAKPSKRDLDFSEKELKTTHTEKRLNSQDQEIPKKLKNSHYLRIDNTNSAPEITAQQAVAAFGL